MEASLCRIYRRPGGIRGLGEPVLVIDGRAFDLEDFGSQSLPERLRASDATPGALRAAARAGRFPEAAPIDPDEELLPPVLPSEVGKILALGKNFRAHAEEFDEEVPTEPMFFNKLPETLVGHRATVSVPSWYTDRFDHEAELALLIGKPGRDIDPTRAYEHVAAYTVANDLTGRTMQGADRALKYPWFRAKNFAGSCPLGPCLLLADPETGAPDPNDWRVTATVNGEPRQDASTAQLVVGIPQALAWLSKHLPLNTCDVVLMGTPAGVGPLADEDEVVCAIESIGALMTRIARPIA